MVRSSSYYDGPNDERMHQKILEGLFRETISNENKRKIIEVAKNKGYHNLAYELKKEIDGDVPIMEKPKMRKSLRIAASVTLGWVIGMVLLLGAQGIYSCATDKDTTAPPPIEAPKSTGNRL